MKRNLGFRFFVIAFVVLFMGWKSYQGLSQDKLELGIDLKGGSELIFQFEFAEDMDSASKSQLLKEAMGVIQDRIDGYGLKDIALQPIGDERFSVQISAQDKEKVDPIKELVTDLGRLEFRITVEPSATESYAYYWKLFRQALEKGVPMSQARTIRPEDVKKAERDRFPEGLRWYPLSQRAKQTGSISAERLAKDEEGETQPWMLCELDTYDVSGDSLFNVFSARSQSGLGGGFEVHFSVKKMAQRLMAGLTAFEEDKYMAIILNESVDSAPILRNTLSDRGVISGSFSQEEARSLAAILQAGALQQAPIIRAERTIAPELAGSARLNGMLSTMIGFVLVLGIMIFLYFRPGLLANLALLLNLVILIGVLTWFEAVLTLPGIAGVVLTVGMAVDANILVFERIKEERSKGRTVAQAITTGYDRALVTIIDANLTTLITAYFLFQIGSGPVRGFGITLAIGIIASMFTALYVTRTVFEYFLRKDRVKEATMRGAWSPPSIPWMSFMRKAALGSTIAIIAGIVLWEVVPDGTKYDLDFTKGSKLIVRFHETRRLDAVRDALTAAGAEDPLYRDVAVRATAEGIGATVGQDASTSFELRSQNVATEQDIEAFKAKLRDVFEGQLLPGPFEATVQRGPGGGSVGRIYFLNDAVTADLLRAAFDQWTREKKVLEGARVEPVDVPASKRAGAGSIFDLAFRDSADQPGQLALNVRNALANFDLEAARNDFEEIATSDASTRTEQQEAERILASLEGFEAGALTESYFEEADPFPLADRIDPSTAEEHRDAAIKAVALSILGIIIYVAFRFRSWSYGFAAVVALVHDVVVVLGIVALVNWLGLVDARLNLVTVAAFLTLIGYSINDSIVVFDRIRENRGTGRARLAEIIDKSINQTLSRTLRTTGTTWIVVIILFGMNLGANSALEGFAFILALGVLVGTYSSIFVASPTLLFLPWLWERCGANGKAFAKKALPYVVGAAIVLLVFDTMRGHISFARDSSVEIFNDILLAFPVGLMALFLWNFLRFTRSREPQAA